MFQICLGWGGALLTDVFLSTDFLEDVDLLHRRLSDLLDLLWGHLVRGGDVDDLHSILLRRPFVDAAPHHAAHSPEEEERKKKKKHISLLIYSVVSLLISSDVSNWTPGISSTWMLLSSLHVFIPYITIFFDDKIKAKCLEKSPSRCFYSIWSVWQTKYKQWGMCPSG